MLPPDSRPSCEALLRPKPKTWPDSSCTMEVKPPAHTFIAVGGPWTERESWPLAAMPDWKGKILEEPRRREGKKESKGRVR